MTTEEWAYIAGFFDGEGWITLATINGRHIAIRIGITQKKIEVLLWIKARLGFGYLENHYGGGNYTFNKCSQLLFGKQREQLAFLIGILPYLHVKRTKAEAAITFLELKIANRQGKMGPAHKTPAMLEAEKHAYERMRLIS
jgi:intein/homing endonuclease